MENFKQDLHQRFVQLALQRKNLTRQLQALLPEIYKQQIYKQKGCSTIYEYAWKYAGFSKALTDKIVQVGKHVENLPYLKNAIEKVGIHKVGMVSTLATPETDQAFAGHVTNMSKSALFEFSKELRHKGEIGNAHATPDQLSFVDENESKNLQCQAVPEKIKIELDDEMQIMFLQLKKEFKKEMSHQEALKIMLGKLLKENSIKKSSKSKTINKSSIPGNGKNIKLTKLQKPSRYIPKSQEYEILQKYNHQCAYPDCKKPYEILHHRERFASSKNHESIIPLCKEHHEFMHNGLINNEINEPENWELNINPDKNFIDKLFLKYRLRPRFYLR